MIVDNKEINSEYFHKTQGGREDQPHACLELYLTTDRGEAGCFKAKLHICVELEDALAGKAVIPVFWVPGSELPALVAAPVRVLGRREVRSTLEGVLEKAPVDMEVESVDEWYSTTLWNCGEPFFPGDREVSLEICESVSVPSESILCKLAAEAKLGQVGQRGWAGRRGSCDIEC